jgi:hypothetical protein
MDEPTSLVRRQIGNHLSPGQKPRLSVQNSCSKTGDAGESWLIATDSHLLIGTQSLAGDLEFEAYPLAEITGIERDSHGLGRGKLIFLSGQKILDQLEYSALDSDKFQTVDQEILSLVRKRGGRPAPPPIAESAPTVEPPQATPTPREIQAPRRPEPPPREKPAAKPSAEVGRQRLRPSAPPTPLRVPVPLAPKPPQPPAPKPREPRPEEKVIEIKPGKLSSAGGTGSPNIVILLPSTRFSPAELVPTQVRLRQKRPVRCRGVRLHLRGMEQTKITHGSGNNRSTSRERRIIVDEEHILYGHRSQPVGDSVADALATLFQSGKHPTLATGNYEWDTRLFLPEGALPSYAGRHGSVNYSLKAYVDIPMSFDVAKNVDLLIIPNEEQRQYRFVPMREPTYSLTKMNRERGRKPFSPSNLKETDTLGMARAGDIVLEAEVNGFTWGKESKIRGRLRFENPRRREIRGLAVTAELVEEAHAGSHIRRVKAAEKRAFSRLSFNGAEFPWRGFSVPAPRQAPPFTGRLLRLDLVVTVSLDVTLHKDVKVAFVARPGSSE